MSALTEIVIATRADAPRVASARAPSGAFEGLDAKGLDPVKLGTLRALLRGERYETSHADLEMIGGDESEGPWVFEVPADFVEELAATDAAGAEKAAPAWAKTDELDLDSWVEEDALAMIRDLSDLARRARTQGKGLLVWMRL